jgi:ComF family protein
MLSGVKGHEYIDCMIYGPRLHARLLGWLRARIVSQCAVCRSWPSQPVCASCLQRFAGDERRCRTCALALSPSLAPFSQPSDQCPDCLRQPPALQTCFAAVAYSYPWSELISRYKFHNQTGWADFLAGLLLRQSGALQLLQGLSPQDWLLPLPLANERLAQRGFNQSWELASALHRQSRCEAGLDAQLLLRLRHTRPQSQLKRADRLDNVKAAFAVEPLQAHHLRGRRVVLVDDVMTSGSSLFAAAGALRAAGVASVSALVIARTPTS